MSQMPLIRHEGSTWVVRLVGVAGHPQEYHCATEAQALRLRQVLAREAKTAMVPPTPVDLRFTPAMAR